MKRVDLKRSHHKKKIFLIVMDVDKTHCGAHFSVYTNIEPMCCLHCLVTKSCPTLVTPWSVAHQAPLSMGFFRQEYWSRFLPFPSPEDLPDSGIKPASLALVGLFFTIEPREAQYIAYL